MELIEPTFNSSVFDLKINNRFAKVIYFRLVGFGSSGIILFGKRSPYLFVVRVVSSALHNIAPGFHRRNKGTVLFIDTVFSKTVQKRVSADLLAEVADSVPVGLTKSHGTAGGWAAGILPRAVGSCFVAGTAIKAVLRYVIVNYFLFLCMQKCPERLPAGSVRRMKRECSENLQQYPLL